MWSCLPDESTVCVCTISDTDSGHRHVEMVKKALVRKVAEGFG
jgi:hypothetical protein